MALACRTGTRECSGCGACQKEPPDYTCPVCGRAVDEKVYILGGEVVGCENCIRETAYWEVGLYV